MQIIPYADLTWPEVAALPRGLPMLIPLGQGEYDLEAAAARLGADRSMLAAGHSLRLPAQRRRSAG